MDTDITRPATAGLAALVRNLVDYAGLFPPAKLDMATTVANYASYVAGADAWMLERLIVPVARLDEFEQAFANVAPSPDADVDAWPIAAITAPAGHGDFADDLERIERFNRRHGGADATRRAVIDVIELKAPSADAIDASLDIVPGEIFPFFEIDAGTDPRGMLAVLVGSDAGAKIRTGGVTKDLYPGPDAVARFIAACARAGVPFKATAGLHHPLRHRNDAVGVDEFGFLNVFVAGVLAYHHELGPEALLDVLEARDIGAFTFDDHGLAFGDRRASPDEIEDARLMFAVSYGSCSFEEPREDLRALKLLA